MPQITLDLADATELAETLGRRAERSNPQIAPIGRADSNTVNWEPPSRRLGARSP